MLSRVHGPRSTFSPRSVSRVPCALPTFTRIGSVEVTEVQVRGKPYNLAPVSRDNVARFEVK